MLVDCSHARGRGRVAAGSRRARRCCAGRDRSLAGRRRVDRRRRLSRRRVRADAVDARAVAVRRPFGIAVIALPLVVVALVALRARVAARPLRCRARGPGGSRMRSLGRDLAKWERVLWLALVAWLAVRFALLAVEVASRPLYPWDAWTQWATKARVWYELRPHRAVRARRPSGTRPAAACYFDASPEYPPTMPLLQVWTCLVLGRWDDVLMNAPWWQIGRRARVRGLRRAALARRERARRDRRRVPRVVAAARQRARRAGRLRRPAAGRLLHRRRARADALGARARRSQCRGRRRARGRVHADQESRAGSGRRRSCPRRVVVLLPRHGVRVSMIALRRRRVRARRGRPHEALALQLPPRPRFRSAVARSVPELLPARQLESALVRRRRRRRSSPDRQSAVAHARADDDDRDRRLPVPVLRVRVHQRERVHRRPDDGEPRDAPPRAADGLLHDARLRGLRPPLRLAEPQAHAPA